MLLWLFKLFTPKTILRRCLLKRWQWRSILTYFVLVSFSTVVLIAYPQSDNDDRSTVSSNSSIVDNEVIQCRFPQLSLYNADLNVTDQRKLPSTCNAKSYPVIIENNRIRLSHPYIDCIVTFYLGEGDAPYKMTSTKLIYNQNTQLLSDYFVLKCDRTMRRSVSSGVPYASVHYNEHVHKRLANFPRKEDEFNVLILGIDSVSRLQFERMLPKTFHYLTKELETIVLKGYNILGDGTPQQLIPMLTSFKETELPTTLRRHRNSSFVDVYPFIWNHYRKYNYVTGYAEDRTEYGIWTLRLKGFRKTPTDHYLPPFYRIPATRSLISKRGSHCIGNRTAVDVFLSYVDQFWSSYSRYKKFFFGFLKQYTHDGYIGGTILDDSFLKFLRNFRKADEHKKTILILMTDHGARFSATRRTPQGKLEERLPFMSFTFPKLFRKKYPKAIENLQKNIHRLTTPFDIHATLLSLLNMNEMNYNQETSVHQRNISLFHIIPAQRTCSDLNLEPHWCSCLQWKTIETNDDKVQQATKHIIKFINNQLSLVENNLCQQLELHSIHNAQMYRPNAALLTFSKSSDVDGRVPKYDDNKTNIIFYQITFETSPNGALYEATTQHSTKSSGFVTDLDHVSRLNAYQSSAACIETSYSHLRKFCQCIK
ncbi:unnamed protein product [Adineta ricciae]|uniref:DUF229 domain containing protein n=1 Tax=Adineta ricciae TaxID=249248 RepID=A0A813SC19_ADIRI|nr:unnamed protein product [Adineta ricciae]